MRVELPIVSCVSALIVLVPLPWHWKTRNVCTTSAILWLAACNIIRTINTFVWLDNDVVKYKVWCDIVTRVELGANIGVPAATVCICRRLAHVSTPYHRTPNSSEKRQRVKFEIGMCVLLPIIFTALHVIVEPCRFGITEGFGCGACYYPSVPALFITQIPTILLSWAALIYSGVTLRWLIHRRAQFRQAQITRLTYASSRYLRIVTLVLTQMTFASVMSLFLMTVDMHAGINSWTSWEDVHQDWKEAFIVSKGSMPELYWELAMVGWYFVPIASITTFGYFGFDDRVAAEYRSMFTWIKAHTICIRAEKVVLLPMSSANDAIPRQIGSDANTIVIDMGRGNDTPASDSLGLEETQLRDISGQP